MSIKSVSFVIPTKNESATISEIVDRVREESLNAKVEICQIIITDDSSDETREIARRLGVEVVLGGGRGLGLAMLRGLKFAALKNPDVIISLDADGQVDLGEIKTFIRKINESNADLVLGSRFLEKGLIEYKYPKINRFGVMVLSFILRKFTGIKITDSHGGIRAVRPRVVNELELIGTHTYVQETIIDAKENGFKIIEIPSRWLKRKSGKSRVVGSIPKYIFYTLPVLILRSGNHIKYLFGLGLFTIALSFLDLFIVLIDTNFRLQEILDRQSLVLFFVLLSTGINMFLFGYILELISQLKRKSQ